MIADMENSTLPSRSIITRQEQSRIELQDLPPPDVPNAVSAHVTSPSRPPSPSGSVSSLPPADKGKAAWFFLIGCFFVETFLWGGCSVLFLMSMRNMCLMKAGFPFSYGVLQDNYITHEPFKGHSKGVSAVGTTCSVSLSLHSSESAPLRPKSEKGSDVPFRIAVLTSRQGTMYIAAPILFSILQQYPRWRRKACIYGLLIVSLSLILSSFCRTITTLILTQGLLYALGGCLLYYPIYLFIDEWFVTRKGFAYGIMWAGSGIGGLLGPLIMGRLLTAYGFEVMIHAWGVAMLLISGPLLYFVKPRLPVSRNIGSGRWRTGWQFITTRTFWILQAGNVVQGLGYFIPALYLPGKDLSLLSRYLLFHREYSQILAPQSISVPSTTHLSSHRCSSLL